jgi:PhoPQ-activated pathogenicity-related protein
MPTFTPKLLKQRHQSVIVIALTAALCLEPIASYGANALEKYVEGPDPTFAWTIDTQTANDNAAVTQIVMRSQTWRGNLWKHEVMIIRAQRMRHPEIALLFISGDNRTPISTLQMMADRAGAVVVELTRVPNQPLYDGRREDALLAYTFDQYLRTGDETWPALFPMTKSAVRAMDAVQAWASEYSQLKIEKFIVAGASKRGWTAWLTGAVDPRVVAIAPMVIDVLNMKAQMDWAQKVNGKHSDKISAYTELKLIEQLDSPPMQKLQSWVDPYSYRARYTIPKLLLLGTNDPYWTVDSLRHYWNDLPDPKLVFQSPNYGHRLGEEAFKTLAAFFQMVADQEDLPRVNWQVTEDGDRITVGVNRTPKAINLWTALSPTRDFRKAEWIAQRLDVKSGSSQASAVIEDPSSGYRAFMGEVELTSSTGDDYKLSTPVQVIPDIVK